MNGFGWPGVLVTSARSPFFQEFLSSCQADAHLARMVWANAPSTLAAYFSTSDTSGCASQIQRVLYTSSPGLSAGDGHVMDQGVVLLRSQGSKLEDLGCLLRSEGVSAYARSGSIVERREVPRAQGLGLVCAIFCTRISPTSCRNAPLHRCGSPMRFGRPQVDWPSLVR